jgi:cytochrome c-type biogenesis protein
MIEYILAFAAGLISFLSPCVLPLIPGYISFVSGQSLQELLSKKKINLLPLVLFCFGFSTVFIVFGATASFLGQILLQNSQVLRIVAGIIIIIFSLQIIGFINFSFLNVEKRLEAKKTQSFIFPYIIGLAFGFGWTPCIGPILGSILALAAIEETLGKAIFLLILYSLGLAIPFILSGYLIQRFLLFSKNFKKNINLISKFGGIILLITGILILTDQLQVIGFYMIEIFPFMQDFG